MTEGITYTVTLVVIVLLGCIGGTLVAAAVGDQRWTLPAAAVIMVALSAAVFGGRS